MKNAVVLCDDAINELVNVPAGTEFMVRDLFLGYFWNSLERATRLKVGILFFEEAKKMTNLIEISYKNSANQQIYKKK